MQKHRIPDNFKSLWTKTRRYLYIMPTCKIQSSNLTVAEFGMRVGKKIREYLECESRNMGYRTILLLKLRVTNIKASVVY